MQPHITTVLQEKYLCEAWIMFFHPAIAYFQKTVAVVSRNKKWRNKKSQGLFVSHLVYNIVEL